MFQGPYHLRFSCVHPPPGSPHQVRGVGGAGSGATSCREFKSAVSLNLHFLMQIVKVRICHELPFFLP